MSGCHVFFLVAGEHRMSCQLNNRRGRRCKNLRKKTPSLSENKQEQFPPVKNQKRKSAQNGKSAYGQIRPEYYANRHTKSFSKCKIRVKHRNVVTSWISVKQRATLVAQHALEANSTCAHVDHRATWILATSRRNRNKKHTLGRECNQAI